ncbi:type I-C CRISPR-associated protein Cas5c [Allisonella histaminiformans]|uniref:type I-C CRISPR-associated protein Cas5c n=1 Tax=Allisonella histaminiformans TaxID=209880 RepID=UPI002E77AEFC|nr:type I-C CRISPR-associated protein Cas5c [Allisonella histaminiformans]
MSYGVRLMVWGDYALFTRPELKVERVSYDCITPSAARGILEAIFWHPGLKWKIDCIQICNPIRFGNIRRNEVATKIDAEEIGKAMTDGKSIALVIAGNIRQQRASMILKDVRYVIDAHFEMTDNASPSDNPGKFAEMFKRRARKGQCFHHPYLGCREFPCQFKLLGKEEMVPSYYAGKEQDFGLMLYDMNYQDKENITPIFFRAKMKDGILDLRDCEVYQ